MSALFWIAALNRNADDAAILKMCFVRLGACCHKNVIYDKWSCETDSQNDKAMEYRGDGAACTGFAYNRIATARKTIEQQHCSTARVFGSRTADWSSCSSLVPGAAGVVAVGRLR